MFTHLHVHSCYSFLDGASTPRQLVQRAADLGMQALALTDHDSVAGAVEFYRCAREAGIKPIQGAEVTVAPLGRRGIRPARHAPSTWCCWPRVPPATPTSAAS